MPIALLALNELEDRQAQDLRSHLQSCEGCRRYFEEISVVTEKMAAVENTSEIEASSAFHRKVVAQLHAQESPTGRKIAGMLGNLLNWRLALPATAICVMLMIDARIQRQISNIPPQPRVPIPTHIVSADPDVPPTIGNYQMAADQSLQKFDELLNQEAKQGPPPIRAYTASTLTLVDVSQ
jgi:hypothetical protein